MSGRESGDEELLEQVAALKHDLGKYVAWTSANLEDALWEGPVADELVHALRTDLLETRKHAGGSDSAWAVWRAHRSALPVPLEPELEAVERAVAMVGDGVNDAPAMRAATVGVAVRGGAEVALRVADVHLARGGVLEVVELVSGARRTLAIIRRNLGFSLVYNLLFASLALAGLIDPLAAAVLMPASSLTVILSSSLGRSFRAGEDPADTDAAETRPLQYQPRSGTHGVAATRQSLHASPTVHSANSL
ncbi:MAG: hypothetical protein KC457_28210 [Myxococcales bacterium]|nr:hypothetical protein [Myxococcales bacterium]